MQTINQIIETQNIEELHNYIKEQNCKCDFNSLNLNKYIKVIYKRKDKINLEILKLLIDNGFDIKKYRLSSFVLILFNKDFITAQFLIDNGLDINKKYDDFNHSLLTFFTMLSGRKAIYNLASKSKLPKKYKSDIIKIFDSPKNTNHIEIIKFLLKNKIDINIRNASGYNAYNIAEDTNNIAIMKLLYDEGIEVDKKDFFSILKYIDKNSNTFLSIFGINFLVVIKFILKNSITYFKTNSILKIIKDSWNILIIDTIKDWILIFKNLILKIMKKPIVKHVFLDENDLKTIDKFLPLQDIIKQTMEFNELKKIILKRKTEINKQDENNENILFLAVRKNNKELVELLLNNRADILLKNKDNQTVFQICKDEEIRKLLFNAISLNIHTPKRFIQLLTNFRQDTPIKYTTHLWDMNFKDEYKDFDGYMKRVKEQWILIEDELKTLSPRLHKIIYNFLLNDDDDENAIWYNYNNEKLNIGWSSLKGLREWCNNGNDPFKFQLEKECRVNNQTLKTFGEVITLFKQEIQIRRENNVLENIFIDIEERLDEELEGVFEFELVKLKGKTFYTDVMVFKDVLHRIFEMVKLQPKHNKIKIMIEEDSNDSYYELKIIQEDSLSGKSAKEMLDIVNGGDFSTIKESLTNLCDFSIESSYEDENYRINYLSNMNENDIEILEDKPQGFTYMLRFYR